MKVLIIGSGAREHALAWKIKQSRKVKKIFISGGNAGTEEVGKNVELAIEDNKKIVKWAKENKISLVVIGPEAPLINGLADSLRKAKIKVFGPGKDGAKLEGSKIFAKNFMEKHNIPTAKYHVFKNYKEAKKYLSAAKYPIVIKADGLAAGKGVAICNNKKIALDHIKKYMVKRQFGKASESIVIEEFLNGREVSILCFTDGLSILPMAGACDYKKAFDDDKGPNTGGMGAYSPPEFLNKNLHRIIQKKIIKPTLTGLRKEKINYSGVIYFGIIITDKGPKMLEYNVRFGDPETQVILPRLNNDLVEVMIAVCDKKLKNIHLSWKNKISLAVVIAARGYPENYKKGIPLPKLETKGSIVFQAGTKKEKDKLVSTGGRVLSVVTLAPTLSRARKKVYSDISKWKLNGFYHRNDIGKIK